jgi:ubiquinone biosynthesis monooxygenase Coq6
MLTIKRLGGASLRQIQQPYVCHACSSFQKTQRQPFASARSNPDIYDVVCVGGGPAGLALLNALRIRFSGPCDSNAVANYNFFSGASDKTSSLKVALVESQDLDQTREWGLPRDVFSNRVSSLTPSSVGFLQGQESSLVSFSSIDRMT